MRLIIEEDKRFEDAEIRITCPVMTPQLEELVALIRLHTFSVAARKGDETHLLHLNEVFYFESVDGKTFIYAENEVYETDLRLYQLEEELARSQFSRVSKSVLLNLTHLKSVKSLANGRMSGTLDNGEQVIITRRYVSELKKKLGL